MRRLYRGRGAGTGATTLEREAGEWVDLIRNNLGQCLTIRDFISLSAPSYPPGQDCRSNRGTSNQSKAEPRLSPSDPASILERVDDENGKRRHQQSSRCDTDDPVGASEMSGHARIMPRLGAQAGEWIRETASGGRSSVPDSCRDAWSGSDASTTVRDTQYCSARRLRRGDMTSVCFLGTPTGFRSAAQGQRSAAG